MCCVLVSAIFCYIGSILDLPFSLVWVMGLTSNLSFGSRPEKFGNHSFYRLLFPNYFFRVLLILDTSILYCFTTSQEADIVHFNLTIILFMTDLVTLYIQSISKTHIKGVVVFIGINEYFLGGMNYSSDQLCIIIQQFNLTTTHSNSDQPNLYQTQH